MYSQKYGQSYRKHLEGRYTADKTRHGYFKINFKNYPKVDMKTSPLRVVNKPNPSHLECFIAAIHLSKFQRKAFLINMIRMQILHLNVITYAD